MSDNNTIKTSRRTNTLAPFESGEINPITPLTQRSMFWRPIYLDQSAWLEHIPFAFWLVEAQHPGVMVELGANLGVSYFAFCQGVNRLGLNARCFAVDTWKGNEQTFDKLNAHNDAQYSGFSRLVRSTFDDALENFSNGSIDLLHIDELQNYETIKHNLEAWLPKLSKNAVVILHGTNIREKQIGNFKYFEELKEHYPWFEFSHGQGLGILGIGKEQNEILSRLFDMSAKDASTQVVREVFARLGRACTDSLESRIYQNKADELTQEIEHQKKICEELKISLGETKKDLDSRKKETIEVKSKLQSQIEQHSTERGQLNERVNHLHETRLELKEDVDKLQGKLETAFVRLAEKGQELTRLALESTDLQRQINVYGEQIKDRDSKLAEKDQALNAAGVNAEQLNQALQEARANNARLMQMQAEKDQALNAAGVNAEQLNQALQEARAKADQSAQTFADQKQNLENKLQERFNELAILTKMIEEREAQLQIRNEEATADHQHIEQLTNDLRVAAEEATADHQHIEQLTNDLRVAAEEATADHQHIEQLTNDLRVAADKHQSLSNELDERLKEIDTLTKLLRARDRLLMVKTQEIETEKQRTVQLKKTFSWRITAPLRTLARTFKKNSGYIDPQISLIEQSGLFEPIWYLDQYPDVAGNHMEPIEHYLRHGAAEGRDPGPHFDTEWYLNTYSDVAEAGVNPLVHYIKVGKQEGRQSMPSRGK